jgi:hypothetical protein
LTIDIRTVSTMDVSKENETYNISENLLPPNSTVSAIRWLSSSRNHFEARILVLRAIFSLILEKLPDLRLWCIVGDSAWQTDTRIIRHKKLFKRLKARGVEITHANSFIEEIVERDGKLKFFGAAQLSELSIESIVSLMAEESCSYLLAVPEEFGIQAITTRGWDACGTIDSSLLCSVVENNGLILKMIGTFDDPETGFVGLGMPDLVRKLEP